MRRRACSIGACPRCGTVLFALSDDWLDAERAVVEHLEGACAEPAARISVRPRPMLRSA
jgi:hypothetical protein